MVKHCWGLVWVLMVQCSFKFQCDWLWKVFIMADMNKITTRKMWKRAEYRGKNHKPVCLAHKTQCTATGSFWFRTCIKDIFLICFVWLIFSLYWINVKEVRMYYNGRNSTKKTKIGYQQLDFFRLSGGIFI